MEKNILIIEIFIIAYLIFDIFLSKIELDNSLNVIHRIKQIVNYKIKIKLRELMYQMIWKPDSIEQFVKYKIIYGEQSQQALKTYQYTKKHNIHIDKLYQELNKYRTTLNNYKLQLNRLNQISLTDVSTNYQQVDLIDNKIERIKEQIKDAKNTIIMNENIFQQLTQKYQDQIHQLQQKRKQQSAKDQEIKNFITKIKDLNYEQNAIKMRQQIAVSTANIQKFKQFATKRLQLQNKIINLKKRYAQLQIENENIHGQIQQSKQKNEILKKKATEIQNYQTSELKKKLTKINEQILRELTEKGIIIPQAQQDHKAREQSQIQKSIQQQIQQLQDLFQDTTNFVPQQMPSNQLISILILSISKNIKKTRLFLEQISQRYIQSKDSIQQQIKNQQYSNYINSLKDKLSISPFFTQSTQSQVNSYISTMIQQYLNTKYTNILLVQQKQLNSKEQQSDHQINDLNQNLEKIESEIAKYEDKKSRLSLRTSQIMANSNAQKRLRVMRKNTIM